MALVIDAVVGSPTMNSFCTLAEAELYHEARLHNAGWTSASTATKNAALAWATKQLCTLAWRGVRTVANQPLEHPRYGLSYYEDGGGEIVLGFENMQNSGLVYYDSAVVAQPIKDAQAELALWLIESDTTANTGTEGFSRLKLDTLEMDIKASDRPAWFQDSVKNLVWRFLANTSKFSAKVQRVG